MPAVRPVQHRGAPDPCTAAAGAARSYPWRAVARSSREEVRWRSASTPDDRPTRRCSSTSTGSSGRTSRSGRTRPTPPSASRSGRPAIAARRSTAPSTRRTSRPRPRRSAATARGQGTDGPLFIGRDTHALSEPAFETALEASPRTASTSGSTPPTATRRRRPSRTRSSSTTAAAREPPGRRHRRHAVAQPARGRRLQVQPAERRPGRHRRHELDPGRGEPAARGRTSTASGSVPARAGARAGTTGHDFVSGYVDDLASVIDMDADPRRPGCGSASIRWAARASPTGRPSRDRYGLDLTVTNDVGRPAVRVHDLRLGRPDPDGPVVAVRDGPAGRAARPVRRRVRQRHRRRPARHRHARRRPAQPEPLPVGRGRPPVRRRPRLGRRTWPSARRSSRAR